MESHRNGKVIVPKSLATSQVKRAAKVNSTAALKEALDFIDLFGILMGWKFSYEWKSNPRHWITMICFFFTWTQIFYSQFMFAVNGEHRRIIEVFAVYGISISCSLRIRCYLINFKSVTALHDFNYKITRLADINVAEALERRQRYNLKIYKVIAFAELASVLIYLYHPIKSFVVNHELVPLLPIEIMFIDQTELSGFLVANFLMTIMGVYAVFGSVFVALHFYAVILNYSIQVDLIEFDVRQLDALWMDNKTSTLSYRNFLLKNICQKSQDKENYIAEIKKIFDGTIYLYFAAVYISQIICLYEVEVENWISGYGIAFGMFVEMLLQCLFGTMITTTNERLCYILTQSNWYTYDVPSQRIFLILLDSCMNAKSLWIGPLAPLSVVTGIQIFKSIYTYYTFLAEVV